MSSRPANPRTSSRHATVVNRVCAGTASTLVIGAALLAGGMATLVTASAHTFGSPATTPKTTGTAFGGGFVAGSAVLNDTAKLGSDVTADRVVKFQLWGPFNANCSPAFAAPVFKQTVQAVNGPGTVHTTGGYAAKVAGTYQWTAQIVAPDGTVEDSSDCGTEPVLIVSVPHQNSNAHSSADPGDAYAHADSHCLASGCRARHQHPGHRRPGRC